MQNTQHQQLTNNDQQRVMPEFPNQQVYAFTQEFVNLSKLDFISMRDKLVIYEAESNRLRIIIDNNERTIKNLEAMNDGYCKKIEKLEKENNESRENIKKIKDENIQLKKKIQELEKRIITLNKEKNEQKTTIINLTKKLNAIEENLSQKQMRNTMKKYEIAIQDYNSRYQFENHINEEMAKNMRRLRGSRTGDCHYCDNKLSNDEANGMFFVMNEKINNMPKNIENEFEKKYPGLIKEFKEYLKYDTFRTPSDELLEDANDWWNDV
jgi:chromosome segregation ATPase